MEAKMLRVTSGEFLNVNADAEQEEIDILTRVSDSVRPRCLPVGVEFVEQVTYRHATWSSVITLQIFKDDRWNEFRVRNVKNGEVETCIDTLYRDRKLDDVIRATNQQIQSDTTL